MWQTGIYVWWQKYLVCMVSDATINLEEGGGFAMTRRQCGLGMTVLGKRIQIRVLLSPAKGFVSLTHEEKQSEYSADDRGRRIMTRNEKKVSRGEQSLGKKRRRR